jgi:glycosyltransferase involved in cell wall biosynthesis
MLGFLPDGVPPGVVDLVADKSDVLPVPLERECFMPTRNSPRDGSLTLVWNHRWEHDKAPERFFSAVERLVKKDIPLKIHILGQRFRDVPSVFAVSRKRLGERIGEFGFIEDRQRYRCVLFQSDVAVSTALHDFQGLSILDATAAGCLPLVPDRLAYREFLPEEYRYESLPDDPEAEAEILADHLLRLCRDPGKTRSLNVPDISYLSWEKLAVRYREVIEEAVQSPEEINTSFPVFNSQLHTLDTGLFF